MKNIIYLLEFLLIKILFIIFKIIGYKLSSNIGCLIGKVFGPIFRSKKKIVNNLKKANFKNNINLHKIASNVLGNYGRIFAEYVFLKDFRNDNLKNYISIEGLKYLEDLKISKKKAVFISGHFSNFELMAMQIEKSGINVAAIYRPLNNIFLNNTMEKIRKKSICKIQIEKGRAGTRKILKNLNNGNSIAIMIDQRVREGQKIPFFGNQATTTTIPAQLVKKYNCPVVPIYIERNNKHFFKIKISKPIEFEKDKTIFEISLFLNNILEKMIAKNLDQWIWTHNRWKS